MRRLHNNIVSIKNDYLEDFELCTLLTTVVENLHAVSHFKHETFQGVVKESNIQNGNPNILLMKNTTIVSPTPARSLQMSNFTRRSTPRLKVLWKNCGEVSFVEAKDSSGGNYQGQGRGFTTSCLHMDLLAGLGNDFNSGDQPVGRLNFRVWAICAFLAKK